MFWVVQALGIVSLICTCISFFFKEKWKMMIVLTVTNISLMTTYILCGSLLGGLLCVGALLRTLIFFFYSKKNKKPEPIVLIFFELYYIVLTVVMWNDPVDLFMLANLMIVTYTSWQDDMRILRFGYIASSLLLIPYDILLGAYTTILSEVTMLISVVIALIKYSMTTKSFKNIAQRYFVANQDFWGTCVTSDENFDMVLSKNVDTGKYYNFGIVKNCSKVRETILQIKKECEENNVKQIAYLPFDSKKYDEFESVSNELNMFFPTEFHDVWMKLVDGFNLNNTKCKLKDVVFQEVDETKIDDVIDVYLKGYHNKTNISDLSDNQKLQIENLKKLKFGVVGENGYKIHMYVAYFKGTAVSLVGMLSNKIETFITKVSTIPTFRRKHCASSLIQFGIDKQRKNGIQNIMLVTDKHSINEKFCAFNNFAEFGQAFALDVTDMTLYEKFLEQVEHNDKSLCENDVPEKKKAQR